MDTHLEVVFEDTLALELLLLDLELRRKLALELVVFHSRCGALRAEDRRVTCRGETLAVRFGAAHIRDVAERRRTRVTGIERRGRLLFELVVVLATLALNRAFCIREAIERLRVDATRREGAAPREVLVLRVVEFARPRVRS